MPDVPEFVETIMERFAGQSTILQEHADKIELSVKDVAQLREDAIGRIKTGFEEVWKRIDDLIILADAAKVAEALDEFTRRIADFGQRLSKLEDRFGETYGKKLDALGSQVAVLTKVGERVAAAEAKAARVSEFAITLDGHGDGLEKLLGRVEKLEAALAPAQQPKETPAEERARKEAKKK